MTKNPAQWIKVAPRALRAPVSGVGDPQCDSRSSAGIVRTAAAVCDFPGHWWTQTGLGCSLRPRAEIAAIVAKTRRGSADVSNQPIKAGLAYFVLVFAAGFVLGALRVTMLEPRLGVRMAELGEMPLMFVVIVFAARFVMRRFTVPPSMAARLVTGMLALALLLAAELLLVVVLQDRALADYVASRDPVSGSAYLAMLVLFALMPALTGQTDRVQDDNA